MGRLVYVVLNHIDNEGELTDSVWTTLTDAIERARKIADTTTEGWVMGMVLDALPDDEMLSTGGIPIFTTREDARWEVR